MPCVVVFSCCASDLRRGQGDAICADWLPEFVDSACSAEVKLL